ncbi:alpha/beta fold hydrolase [Streptomyces sp. NPDC006372]|uniref:thioesterase II family protein n=1 Tax=Streptomyces sp. NPDC006372 TaxID=3155599 RepID=UPI0033B1CD03
MTTVRTTQPRPALVTFRGSVEPRVSLVCIAHAGAGTVPFSSWNTLLPDWVSVVGVRLPGRESRLREPLLTTVEEMAGHIVDALPLGPGPVAFFGHCFGGPVAFRAAQLLEERGDREVVRLITASAPIPGGVAAGTYTHELSSEELFDSLVAAGAMDSGPDGRTLFALLEPTLRADFAAVETWSSADFGTVSAPVLVLRGVHDRIMPETSRSGWGAFTTGGIHRQELPAGHFLLGDAAPAVAATIATYLASDLSRRPDARPRSF